MVIIIHVFDVTSQLTGKDHDAKKDWKKKQTEKKVAEHEIVE